MRFLLSCLALVSALVVAAAAPCPNTKIEVPEYNILMASPNKPETHVVIVTPKCKITEVELEFNHTFLRTKAWGIDYVVSIPTKMNTMYV